MNGLLDPITIAAIIVTLGIGGVVGALANAALAGRRVRDAFLRFDAAFSAYISQREDEATRELRNLFEDLGASIASADSALENLQRALRPRRR
ncbi:MAG: hypothetical protein C4341_10120 [Armatimonadota bacterium]